MTDDGDLSIGPPPIPEVAGPAADPHVQDAPWAEPEPETAPEVPEPVVRSMLAGVGVVLAQAAGDPDVEDHWRFTAQELDDLTPPVARMVNARPALRRAAAHGDEITIAVQMAGYLGRNINDGATARKKRAKLEEEEHGYQHGEAFDPASAGDRWADDGPRPEPEPGAADAVGHGIFPPVD